MAHVMVDVGFIGSDEAEEFCTALGEDQQACWYLIRLWAWGIMHDREDGTIPRAIAVSPIRIAQIVGYLGDPDRLHAALTSPMGSGGKAWIQERNDGRWYMRGWSRTGRYFRERKRLRKMRSTAIPKCSNGSTAQ